MAPDDLPKLVRDRIPAIIRDDGAEPVVERVDDETARDLLAAKLVEEAEEFRESRDPEELADVLEAVERALELADLDMDAVRALKDEKRAERGGFADNIVLRDIEGAD